MIVSHHSSLTVVLIIYEMIQAKGLSMHGQHQDSFESIKIESVEQTTYRRLRTRQRDQVREDMQKRVEKEWLHTGDQTGMENIKGGDVV